MPPKALPSVSSYDSFGFPIPSTLTARQHSRFRIRAFTSTNQWRTKYATLNAALAAYTSPSPSIRQRLLDLVNCHGIAPEYRASLYWAASQPPPGSPTYASLLARWRELPLETLRQIELDLPRTFCDQKDFAVAAESGTEGSQSGSRSAIQDLAMSEATIQVMAPCTGTILDALRRALRAFCVLHPIEGYLQSMNFLGAFLLLIFRGGGITTDTAEGVAPSSSAATTAAAAAAAASISPEEAEARAFWCLERLISRSLSGYYSDGFPELKGDCTIFGKLLSQRAPELAAHLACECDGIDVSTLFLPRWLLCMFLNVFNTDVAVRIWDSVILAGPRDGAPVVLMEIALAFLRMHQEELMSCRNFVEAAEMLKVMGMRVSDAAEMMLLSQTAECAIRGGQEGAAANVSSSSSPSPASTSSLSSASASGTITAQEMRRLYSTPALSAVPAKSAGKTAKLTPGGGGGVGGKRVATPVSRGKATSAATDSVGDSEMLQTNKSVMYSPPSVTGVSSSSSLLSSPSAIAAQAKKMKSAIISPSAKTKAAMISPSTTLISPSLPLSTVAGVKRTRRGESSAVDFENHNHTGGEGAADLDAAAVIGIRSPPTTTRSSGAKMASPRLGTGASSSSSSSSIAPSPSSSSSAAAAAAASATRKQLHSPRNTLLGLAIKGSSSAASMSSSASPTALKSPFSPTITAISASSSSSSSSSGGKVFRTPPASAGSGAAGSAIPTPAPPCRTPPVHLETCLDRVMGPLGGGADVGGGRGRGGGGGGGTFLTFSPSTFSPPFSEKQQQSGKRGAERRSSLATGGSSRGADGGLMKSPLSQIAHDRSSAATNILKSPPSSIIAAGGRKKNTPSPSSSSSSAATHTRIVSPPPPSAPIALPTPLDMASILNPSTALGALSARKKRIAASASSATKAPQGGGGAAASSFSGSSSSAAASLFNVFGSPRGAMTAKQSSGGGGGGAASILNSAVRSNASSSSFSSKALGKKSSASSSTSNTAFSTSYREYDDDAVDVVEEGHSFMRAEELMLFAPPVASARKRARRGDGQDSAPAMEEEFKPLKAVPSPSLSIAASKASVGASIRSPPPSAPSRSSPAAATTATSSPRSILRNVNAMLSGDGGGGGGGALPHRGGASVQLALLSPKITSRASSKAAKAEEGKP